jgi:hypothetical protein
MKAYGSVSESRPQVLLVCPRVSGQEEEARRFPDEGNVGPTAEHPDATAHRPPRHRLGGPRPACLGVTLRLMSRSCCELEWRQMLASSDHSPNDLMDMR